MICLTHFLIHKVETRDQAPYRGCVGQTSKPPALKSLHPAWPNQVCNHGYWVSTPSPGVLGSTSLDSAIADDLGPFHPCLPDPDILLAPPQLSFRGVDRRHFVLQPRTRPKSQEEMCQDTNLFANPFAQVPWPAPNAIINHGQLLPAT